MDVIFDVDGTLLNIEHRIHLIRPPDGVKKDWQAFRGLAWNDHPNLEIIDISRALYEDGHRIIISTGRMKREGPVMIEVLTRSGVAWDRLYMRANDDVRYDHVVKLEMLAQMRTDGFNPILAFDDRQQVVDMWRAQGIRCLQVAQGNF